MGMLLTKSSPVVFLTAVFFMIIVAVRECSAAATLTISINGFQEASNLDTLVGLGSRVSFACNDDVTFAAGDLYFNDEATVLPREDGAWVIASMSVEHQGAYRCCVESLCEEIAVITIPPSANVWMVAAEGEQPTLSCPLKIVERFSQYYMVEWRVPVDIIVARSGSEGTMPWASLNSNSLELTVGPLNSSLPRVFECVALSFKRRNMINFHNVPKGTVNITIPSAQPLYVNVTPTVIAARSNGRFNVSCGVENGQTLYNAEYQFFHNRVSISAPTRSSYTMVPADSTGNFTCNATQYSDQRTAILSAPSLPVQAIVLEAPNLERTEFAPTSTDGCTQQVIGSLNQPQPVNMTLQYFLHTTAQPESCTNELFKQFRTEMSSGQTDVVFDVDIIDSRLDTRQTVYVTSRLMMDGISSPCSRPIPLQITAVPCPPQPPPLNPGEIAGITAGVMTLVVIVSAATASVILGAFWIRRRRKNNSVPVSKAQDE